MAKAIALDMQRLACALLLACLLLSDLACQACSAADQHSSNQLHALLAEGLLDEKAVGNVTNALTAMPLHFQYEARYAACRAVHSASMRPQQCAAVALLAVHLAFSHVQRELRCSS